MAIFVLNSRPPGKVERRQCRFVRRLRARTKANFLAIAENNVRLVGLALSMIRTFLLAFDEAMKSGHWFPSSFFSLIWNGLLRVRRLLLYQNSRISAIPSVQSRYREGQLSPYDFVGNETTHGSIVVLHAQPPPAKYRRRPCEPSNNSPPPPPTASPSPPARRRPTLPVPRPPPSPPAGRQLHIPTSLHATIKTGGFAW